MNYLLRDIEPALWKKVKVLCANREISIRGLIIELLERELKKIIAQ